MVRSYIPAILAVLWSTAAAAQSDAVDPEGLRCIGTEPFWSLELGPETMTYADVEEQEITFAAPGAVTTVNRIDRWVRAGVAPSGGLATVVLMEQTCSDSMSDREYPMEVIVLGIGTRALQGCCGGPEIFQSE